MLALVLGAAIATSMPPTKCAPLKGAHVLLRASALRFVIVGEIHGTNETPVAFADLVCHAAAPDKKVVVALEHPASDQALLDRFMASDTPEAARTYLAASLDWRSPHRDGRTSTARLDLLQSLRTMVRAGRVRRVVAIMPTDQPPGADYEKAMAANIVAAARSGALVLALVGNAHARRVPKSGVPPESYKVMAEHLPAGSAKSLLAVGDGGSAWACMEECGSHELGRPAVSHRRSIKLQPRKIEGYDGILFLGAPTTASPPALLR
jgi:hypothetical protein